MLNNKSPVYAGIDIGASRTKVALLDSEKNLIGHCVIKSGIDFNQTSRLCLESAMDMAGISMDNIACTVSTGYGRKNAPFSNRTKTEIGCHAKGAYHFFPTAITIVDIGGQDNKIIKLDEQEVRGRNRGIPGRDVCPS